MVFDAFTRYKTIFDIQIRYKIFSLFYNTSVRHEQHKCDTRGTCATRVRHDWHECYTNDTSVTRVKNFDLHNDTIENIFSHLYVTYTTNEKFQGEKQIHYKNYLLEMPPSPAKMRLEIAPQTLNLVKAKAISISYNYFVDANVLGRSRIASHSNTAWFSIKTILCETNNVFLARTIEN